MLISLSLVEIEKCDEPAVPFRKEFKRVAWPVYKEMRSEVIRGFLQIPRIYNTELFFGRFAMQARENLDRSLLQLRTGASLDSPS